MPEFDYSKAVIAPFSHDLIDGGSVGYVKNMVLNRAGVPNNHPLRQGLTDTHPTAKGAGVRMVPTPFPPEGVHYNTVGEWFAALDALPQDVKQPEPIVVAPVEIEAQPHES